MIDVNPKGTLHGIAAALPHMKTQQGGHIINVSSVYGHKVAPGAAVYCATEFGVRALSEGLRQEVKPYNIRTTVVSPGGCRAARTQSSSRALTRQSAHSSTRAYFSALAVVMPTSSVMDPSAANSRHWAQTSRSSASHWASPA